MPVLLSHRCTAQEEANRGDGRWIFVRYRQDHSSLVNDDLIPVQAELRRTIAGIMATRQQQILFFSAEKQLTYREIFDVFSALRQDNPKLVIVLLPTTQPAPGEQIRSQFPYSCLSF
jgi:biopolymer transport protein ExbD